MRRIGRQLAAAFRGFLRHHGAELAASIAYQVLFTLIPLTSVLLAGFGFVMRNPTEQRHVVDQLLAVLPLESDAFIARSIRGIAHQSVALTTVGLLGLVWSASGLFGTIGTALNIVWEVRNRRAFVIDKLIDLASMLGLGVLLAASVAGTVAMHLLRMSLPHSLGLGELLHTLRTVLGLALPALLSFITALFLYRFVPNVKHRLRDVWPAAATAALLFEVSKHLFTFYVSHFKPYQTLYGAIGDVMLFMLWTWVSSSILLIGAEVAAAAERKAHGPAVEARPAEDVEAAPADLRRSAS